MPSKSNERQKKRRQARHEARLDQEYGKRVDADLETLPCTLAGQIRGTEYDLVEDRILEPRHRQKKARCAIM